MTSVQEDNKDITAYRRGIWNRIEAYITKHSAAEFSHGICPECGEKLYPGMNLSDK